MRCTRLKASGEQDKAKQHLDRILKQANKERQEKTELRIKRQREFNEKATEKPNKKAKPDD